MNAAVARAPAHDHQPERTGGRSSATCTPGFDIAANPATLQALMRGADAGTRVRLADALQRRHGNAAVQRLLAPAGALPLQRWAVGLARSTTDCERIVSYMNAHSPYSATSGWAQTTARFRWHGDPAHTEEDGALTATVANPRVTPTVDVDMPVWSPTDPAIRDAWSATMADLRAHESRHEEIASEWEATLLGRLSALSVSVADRRRETFTAAVQAAWDGWLAEHQDAQWAIDPYEAVFWCPTPIEEPEAEPAPE